MTVIAFVTRKPSDEMGYLATGVAGPAGERFVEVEIEHDAAEIEQQRVGRAGGEEGRVHWGRVRKSGEAGNRRRWVSQADKGQHFDHRRTLR